MPLVTEKVWEVVIAGANGGIAVTTDQDEGSSPVGRLSKGCLLRQLEPPRGSRHELGQRLHFARISGSGPKEGWVTTSLRDKDYVVRTYDVRAHDLEQQPVPEIPGPLPDGSRPFDVIILGASGYTGTLSVEHLDAVLAARPSTDRPRWALAGRSAAKLRPLAARCKTGPGVLQAEGFEDVLKLAAACRVLIAAAGPYSRFGEDAVKACVQQGTHYVDVTGEVPWVRDMVEKYHQAAQSKGVMVVHFVGQVCTIDEVCCYLLAKKLGPLKQFREYFYQVGGSSGGTQETSIAGMEDITPEELKVMQDPFSLGGERRCGVRASDKNCSKAEQDPLFPSMWLHPAYSTNCGSRAVRRSCQLFENSPSDGISYGENVCVTIREGATSQKVAEKQADQMKTPASVEAAKAAAQMMRTVVASGQAPKPGQGPPPETRKMYYSDAFAVAEAESGEWGHIHYTGPEAYEATAMSCVTAALVLAEEVERLQPEKRGGVLTPAFAMHGSTFVERLQASSFANGSGQRMRFEFQEGKPSEQVVTETSKLKTKNSMVGQSEIQGGKLQAFK